MFVLRYKSFFIFILVCAALYQVSLLWFGYFGKFEDKNNFYEKNFEYIDHAVKGVYINVGNGKFYETDDPESRRIIDNVLKNTAQKGKFKSLKKYDGICQEKYCIIYEFAYKFPTKNMQNLFSTGSKLENKMDKFDRVEVIPENNIPKRITLRFIDKDESQMCEIEYNDVDSVNEIWNISDNINFENDNLYMIKDEKGKYFLPCWDGGFCKYDAVRTVGPVKSESGVLLMSLEKTVNIFFENPALKRSSVVNRVYTYTDDNVVVKYYTNGILEYSNYAVTKKYESDFYTGFLAAVDFINNDTEITNEYYLYSADRSDNQIKYIFNYKINGSNIVLSDEHSKKLGIRGFIEVTVSGKEIIKYSRLIYKFEDTDSVLFANVSGDEAKEKMNSLSAELLYAEDGKKDLNNLIWRSETGKVLESYEA